MTKRRRRAMIRCGSGSSAVKIFFRASATLGLGLLSGAGAPGGVSTVGLAMSSYARQGASGLPSRELWTGECRNMGKNQEAGAAGFVI